MSYKWVSKRVVIAIHNEQIAQHGGLAGLRVEGLLDSALARPQHIEAYESGSLARCAAAYAFGIAKNHPFNDGNKRTCFVVAVTFLLLNGRYIRVSEAEVVQVITQLAEGSLDEAALVEWFDRIIEPH